MTDSFGRPTTEPGWEPYQRWLETRTPEQLADHLAVLNRQLQEERERLSIRSMSSTLSDYLGSLDRTVLRSTPPAATPSRPADRGAPPTPSPQPPSPGGRWATLGPRLAARQLSRTDR